MDSICLAEIRLYLNASLQCPDFFLNPLGTDPNLKYVKANDSLCNAIEIYLQDKKNNVVVKMEVVYLFPPNTEDLSFTFLNDYLDITVYNLPVRISKNINVILK